MYTKALKNLINHLKILPGVGPKTAQRMAFNLLANNRRHQAKQLAESIIDAMDKIAYCQSCRNYCEDLVCDICNDPKRQLDLLCVVESPQDVVAIEQISNFKGKYFVLHGHLSPLDSIGPRDLNIHVLFEQITKNNVSEVIIATNSTVEGEATAHYIAKQAQPLYIKCTRIAHGIPMGGELEYLDGSTLAHALDARVDLLIDQK